MERNKNLGFVILFVVLGLIIGGVLSEALGYLLGKIGEMSGGSYDNPIRNFFVKSLEFDLGWRENGWPLDFYFVKLRVGLGLKFNFCSLLGGSAALYMMKWWRS